MKKIAVLLLIGLVGAAAGFALIQLADRDTGRGQTKYCKNVEEGIRQNQTFNGTISCYPPGVFEVNLSDKVEENTELRCVCRKSYRGKESFFAITSTG